MPYLNFDPDFYTHPKTVRLIVALSHEGVTCLQRLWGHAAKHNPVDGVLRGLLVAEIAEFAGWKGDAQAFVDKLKLIGFLDLHGENYAIHDWKEHQGHIAMYHERAVKAAKKRWKCEHAKAMPRALHNRTTSNASRNAPPSHPILPILPILPDGANGSKTHRSLMSGASPDPRVKDFIDWFYQEFRKRKGSNYHVNGGKDGAMVKKLLGTFDLEELKSRATMFFESEDEYLAKTGFTIGVLASQINKFVDRRTTSPSPLREMAEAAHRHVEAGGKLP